jgi:hypothetical protein
LVAVEAVDEADEGANEEPAGSAELVVARYCTGAGVIAATAARDLTVETLVVVLELATLPNPNPPPSDPDEGDESKDELEGEIFPLFECER